MKEKRDVSRHMAMMWMVSTKDSLRMKDGYSPNQLVFGRNPNLPNLLEENIPSSLESGGEEEYMRGTLNAIHEARVAHIQMESDRKVRQALQHKVRPHQLEMAAIGNEVYYKKQQLNGEAQER